jgi:hypothetical protein
MADLPSWPNDGDFALAGKGFAEYDEDAEAWPSRPVGFASVEWLDPTGGAAGEPPAALKGDSLLVAS